MEKNVLAVIAGREITEEELNAFIHRLPRGTADVCDKPTV